MRKMVTLGLAIASLMATANVASSQTAASRPEVRPDTLDLVVWVAHPPWPACHRWDRRTGVCLDSSWRTRHWRAWYGRSTCRVRGHGWWIDAWGRWRRC